MIMDFRMFTPPPQSKVAFIGPPSLYMSRCIVYFYNQLTSIERGTRHVSQSPSETEGRLHLYSAR